MLSSTACKDTGAGDGEGDEVSSHLLHCGSVLSAVCHAPWVLMQAGLCCGGEITSYPSIRTDLKNAGAQGLDKSGAISSGIILSRAPMSLRLLL
jgi:putative intracellular protease/amidase